jgi:hypothetical protein
LVVVRPEVLTRYAVALVRKVRGHPQEMGCISEADLLTGNLDYQGFRRLPATNEAEILRQLHETVVSHAWCLRQVCDGTTTLTFPSYFRRERPEQPSHPGVVVTYRFGGPVDTIYATLVVRLHHSTAFDTDELWKSAADFRTPQGHKLGIVLIREAEGRGRLDVYFEADVGKAFRMLFLRHVDEHLELHAKNVVLLRHYACQNKRCPRQGQSFTDQVAIDAALSPEGKGKVACPGCGKAIPLRDALKRKFAARP